MRDRFTIRAVLVVLVLLSASSAQAHSMYQAAVLLDFETRSLEAEVQLPPSRLAKAVGVSVTGGTLTQEQSLLAGYLLGHMQLRSPQGTLWKAELQGPLLWRTIDGAPYVVVHMRLRPPPEAALRSFSLQSHLLTEAAPHQVVLVSIRSDWNSSTFANEPELVGILNGDDSTLTIDRSSGGWAKGSGSIFHLGVRHIAEGTDHLLFLLALLLPAPLLCRAGRWTGFAGVRHGFSQILKVVTAFTIGHSLTLALAATGWVHVPAKPIEILIAISILISAVHAIRPLFPGRELFIAGGFGLIHGLAFATTLAELGLRGWERVASILAFNLGIESMQLLVVLCIMPSLMLLSRTRLYRPVRVAGAVFAGVSACGWIVERTTDHSLRVDAVVDTLARHAVGLAVGLLVLAFATNLLPFKEERI